MASFKNVTGGRCICTDEKGLPVEFAGNETRAGLSNWFYRYTSAGNAGLTTPVLQLVGSLDGDGTIPAAVNPQESALFLPGATSTYPKDASTATAADLANLNAPRRYNVTFDEKGDVAYRQIRTVFVGLRLIGDNPVTVTEFQAIYTTCQEGVYIGTNGYLFFVVGTSVFMIGPPDDSGVYA